MEFNLIRLIITTTQSSRIVENYHDTFMFTYQKITIKLDLIILYFLIKKDLNRLLKIKEACYMWKFCYPSLKVKLKDNLSDDFIQKAEIVFRETSAFKQKEIEMKEKEKFQQKQEEIERKSKVVNHHKNKQYFDMTLLFSNRYF
jgi:hypothetical protein